MTDYDKRCEGGTSPPKPCGEGSTRPPKLYSEGGTSPPRPSGEGGTSPPVPSGEGGTSPRPPTCTLSLSLQAPPAHPSTPLSEDADNGAGVFPFPSPKGAHRQISATGTSWDLSEALYCAYVAKLAYKHPQAYTWQEHLLTNHEAPLLIDINDSQAILFRCEHRLIIAFRGSDSSADVYKTIQIAKIPFMVNGAYQGHVHRGFFQYYQYLKPIMMESIKAYMESGDYFPKEIWFTGHSMGSSCVYAAMECAHLFPAAMIKCFTFGSPKLGDAFFRTKTQHVIPVYVRFVYQMDPVPQCPASWCFSPTGPEFYLGRPLPIIKRWLKKTLCFFTWSSCMALCFDDHSIDRYIAELEKVTKA